MGVFERVIVERLLFGVAEPGVEVALLLGAASDFGYSYLRCSVLVAERKCI